MFNRIDALDLLIVHGANIEARDANGVSAMRAANLMGALIHQPGWRN
jgi:hypothetical protein